MTEERTEPGFKDYLGSYNGLNQLGEETLAKPYDASLRSTTAKVLGLDEKTFWNVTPDSIHREISIAKEQTGSLKNGFPPSSAAQREKNSIFENGFPARVAAQRKNKQKRKWFPTKGVAQSAKSKISQNGFAAAAQLAKSLGGPGQNTHINN